MALWDKINTRGDVEDRRGQSVGLPVGLGGFGSIVALVILGISLFTGGDQSQILSQVLSELGRLQTTNTQQVDTSQFQGDDSYEVFASKVIGSGNDLWQSIFDQNNKEYTAPKLVLFRQATRSACGTATSQIGPHYCPNDQTIYLDETFFDELTTQFGAKGGDVAEAYVLAHEMGHHIQNLLGILEKTQNADQQTSINVELQADCYAGIYGRSVATAGILEPNEINEALDATEAVGDDRIQESIEGRVNPETWTHGSSEQRRTWFETGYNTGDPASCNTFK